MTAADERWRCFVAVPVGDELREPLARSVVAWRERPDLAALRWTDPDGWHITVAFVGDVTPPWVDAALRILGEVAARHRPMTFETGGVGGFPRARASRVAWYGARDADGSLSRLSTDVGKALGIRSEHPLRPHVTLARARGGPVDLRGWVAEATPPRGSFAVDRIELMRSRLGRGPAVYERLGSMDLGGAADA